ncbi:hypothetical protein [Microbacterium album]|uniref:Uncharacterized protein n=1 Tax=Microbacterium album TaxID=2053191 RepID=A0A917MKR8_9MICO|nr:hypothetical protein [Microbacterium album]GGH34015.1 hypothetical protein GCM10010921_01390 [Microbacterium album]
MNIQQTNELLLRIQVIDNRQIGDSTVLAWHELVADLDYDVAVEAVRMHRMESKEYLVPAHVRANAERIRLAGIERTDEWGNRIEPDAAAVAALERIRRGRAGQRAVGAA